MAIDKTGAKGQTRIEGTLLEQGLWFEPISTSFTVDVNDIGKVLLIKKTGLTITLLAIAVGHKFLIVYDGPEDGKGALKILPNASDKFAGVDISATDADSMDLTFGKPGDLIQVEYFSADGWAITKIAGNWNLTAV